LIVRDHLSDEALVLHHYGELDVDAAARANEHLAECAACRAGWEDLQTTLGMVGAASVPDPPAGFEQQVWTRVRLALPSGRRSARAPLVWGSIAAALVAAIAGGFFWARTAGSRPSVAATGTAPASEARERVMLTALGDHLSQSEMLLVELLNAPSGDGDDLAFERAAADDLVASGRLYRQTVHQAGDTRFVDVLDDLEGVLVEVARSPDTVNRRDLEFLRERIEHDALLFRVRAATSDIEGRQMTLMYQPRVRNP
jgi:anti-sigma factor RsiW